MKLLTVLALLPLALATPRPGACNANNCARAVTGTAGRVPITSRRAHCSSFQTSTTTVPFPGPTYTTTITVTINGLLVRRTEPTPLPAYASPCPNPQAYASACSCWGITAALETATLPQPTATATVTFDANACSNPGTCGTYRPVSCNNPSVDGTCICASDIEGGTACIANELCTQPCLTNAECGSGRACIVNSCCSGAWCAGRAGAVCANAATPRAIFKPRKVERAVGGRADEGGCGRLAC